MTRPHAPPLHLLRAFTATARAGTISAAAQGLHLTQGAVSKQVLELETWLGVTLFDRVKKRLLLTAPGHRYLHAVQPLLQQLDAVSIDLMSNPLGDGSLHLASLPTFGAKWLIPRLPAFQAQHPRITLHFLPYVDGYQFNRADLDCAVRYGSGEWSDAESVYVTGRRMLLIAPPPARRRQPLRKPADLASHTLLHHQTVPGAWAAWTQAHAPRLALPAAGPQFDQYQTLIRAVVAGLGVGLVPSCLVEQELAHREVSAPLRTLTLESDAGYYLCFPQARAAMPSLQAFRQWLVGSAGGGALKPA